MTINIAISVHNRHETANHSISQWKKYLPKGAKLFVVDDGSDVPFTGADLRNEKAVGIAACKNQCLSLCEGSDYVVLADDDVYPTTKDWHLPYINSGINHLCFTFDKFSNGRPNGRRKIKTEKGLSIWHEPCGLFLFFTRKCLDVVGGMDESYGAWGYEHLQLSIRIYNNGLTPYPYMDVENSLDLFHSEDYFQTVTRSVDPVLRGQLAIVNKRKYQQDMGSKAYIPYKQQTGIILTSYFTGVVDPQRGEKWEADIMQVSKLANSCKANDCKLVLLHDCFENKQIDQLKKSVHYQNIYFSDFYDGKNNPYFQRWLSYRDFLKENPYDNVFMTDCNDVEVLRNPFKIIQPNKLYVGWENSTIGCQWMLNHHKSNFMQTFIKCNMKTPLLNAGVIGGRYDIVMEFLDRLCDMYEILPEKEHDKTDMPLFNWVLYSHFNGRFETGLKVTTEFKAFKSNGTSLFKHK